MWSIYTKGSHLVCSPNKNLINNLLLRDKFGLLAFYKNLYDKDTDEDIDLLLLLHYEFSDLTFLDGAYYYKWFTTNGIDNPTNETDFNNLFIGIPESYGITYDENIDWISSPSGNFLNPKPQYLPNNDFAWEVTGFLKIEEEGEYQFNTRSDDGNQLQINDEIVTSFYGGRGITTGEFSDVIYLTEGYHKFRYRMQQGGGGSGAQVNWKKPSSDSYEKIPSSVFSVNITNGVAVDLSQSNNNGLLNGPLWSPEKLGIITLDGIDDYLSTNNKVTSTQKFTVEVWVKTEQTGYKIIGFESDQTGNNSFSFDRHLYINNDGKVNWGIFTNTGEILTSINEVNNSEWTHIVGIYDGTKSQLWVNGEKQGELEFSNPSIYDGWWRIGSYKLGGSWVGSNRGFFEGSLGLARVWETSLTENKIIEIYNNTKPRFMDDLTEDDYVWDTTESTWDGDEFWDPVPVWQIDESDWDEHLLNWND